MFKKNDGHGQLDIFAVSQKLNKHQLKLWNNSKEHYFYENVFPRIDEEKFACLFSSKQSRPNTPVNQLVGALILKHLYDWTYNELFTHLNFNQLTRHAIGVHSIDQSIFCEASIFNFQNKLVRHLEETGEDLIENVFCQLTLDQLKEFNVDASVQRGDSFLVGSNIIDYTRLGLLIEVLKRLVRILSKEDKEFFSESIKPYSFITASNYFHHVQKTNVNVELEQIAQVYMYIYSTIGDRYANYVEYNHFTRVYKEHFATADNKIEIKPPSSLKSDKLLSPDDDQATYRFKGSEKSKGFVTHLSETSNPDNSIDLITDVHVCENNIGDSEILEQRLPIMMERTPEINEYFADGLYGSPQVDIITKEAGIQIYQKTRRGQKSKSEIRIEEDENSAVWVSCKGGQRIRARKSKAKKSRMQAIFEPNHCNSCPHAAICSIKEMGGKTKVKRRVYYFSESKILVHKRLANIDKLKGKKRHTRANVEATVKEAKRGMKNGKVRVRSKIRVSMHMTFTAIAINLTRIHKYKLIFIQNLISNSCKAYHNFLKIVRPIQYSYLEKFSKPEKIRNYCCF